MSEKLDLISRQINGWVENLVCTMGILMAVIVAAQVFSRYGLNYSLFWSEELARFLLVWITFLGASVAYFYNAHPGVDAVYRHLPLKLQRWSTLVVHVVSLCLFSVMVINGAGFAWFVRLQITPALSLPKWIIMGVVPVSGVIFWVHGLAFLIRAISAKATSAKATSAKAIPSGPPKGGQ
jgi:TRAP-type C4-dicarboxylate transport system permease small subunit